MAEHYHVLCLKCGGDLTAYAGSPDIPPWWCEDCRLFYWTAELTQEARAAYRKEMHDFGHPGSTEHKAVREAVHAEAELAAVRGISLRREQLGLVSKPTLRALIKRHQGRITPHCLAQLTQQTGD
jgi:hypothetical protein